MEVLTTFRSFTGNRSVTNVPIKISYLTYPPFITRLSFLFYGKEQKKRERTGEEKCAFGFDY